MKVYEALARAFVAEGVTAVFGLMGDGNMHWIDALKREGVDTYHVRHEGAGLAMADGWARVAKDRNRSVPGVATATHGPGVTQLATSLVVASRARTPMVIFVGEGPAGDDEFHQRLDHERFAAATECAFVRVTSEDTWDQAVFTAFLTARSESRPVILSVPVAIQKSNTEDLGYSPTTSAAGPGPMPPNPEDVAHAVAIIEESSLPVVLVGRGAIWAKAGEAASRLAEKSGALLATTLLAKNWLNQHPFHAGIAGLYSTRTAINLFERADCVIALGAGLNKFTIGYGYLFPNARYIQIDTSPLVVMGGGRIADLYVRGDARLTAEALIDRLTPRTGFRTHDVQGALEDALRDDMVFEPVPDTLDPREVCRLLDELLPEHVGLVLGGGHQVNFGTILFRKNRELVLANQHFGAIGHGMTTAIGAIIADGNRPTLLVEGDAGLLMHLAEFETAARYDIPLLVAVINDQALGAEYHKMSTRGLDADIATHTTPDMAQLATAMGARGTLATRLEDIRDAVERFLEQPGPMLVDIRVSRNVLSLPFRRLYFGMDV